MESIMMQTDLVILYSTVILVLLIAAIVYIKYDIIRLGGIIQSLNKINGAGEELPEGISERMDALMAVAVSSNNQVLKTVWTDYYREYTDVMKAEIIPDSTYYFNENRLIVIPCARWLTERLTGALLILGFAGALLYPALVLLGITGPLVPESILRSAGLALLLLAAVALLLFLFRIADAARMESARSSLWEFHYKLAGWLNPISEPTEIGVLAASQRQNSLDFQAAVARLEDRLDMFETKTLVPLLGDRFEAAIKQNIAPILHKSSDVLAHLSKELVTRQENGMKELATVFTDKVTAVTEERLNAFAQKTAEVTGNLQTVVSGMNRIQKVIDESTQSQNELSARSFYALEKAAETHTLVSDALGASLDSVRAAEAVAAEMREYAVKGLDKADAMALQSLQMMEGSIAHIKNLQDGITGMAYTLQNHTDNAVSKVSEELTLAVGKYAEISTQIEASRKQMSEETDAKIGLILSGMDDRLGEYSRQVLASNTTTTDKLADAAAAISLSGSRQMEQITGDLARAVAGYTEVSEHMEELRMQHTEELDIRLSRLINETNTLLTEAGSRMEESRAQHALEMDAKIAGLLQNTQDSLTDRSEKIMASNVRTAETLAASATHISLEGGRILEKADQKASELYTDLLKRMDQSIAAMGETLAANMRAAMGDSIEIVEKLSIKTAEMKEMYDQYFSRIEEQSAKTFDDLDFSIQKTLTSFSAETTQIISKITDNSSGALEFFDKGIKELVYNMDENSRSVGLYAKEINVDVADLSANLKESVQTFTSQMQEGIGRTFIDFDNGLGEITLRLATILESIRESAEALQHALKTREI